MTDVKDLGPLAYNVPITDTNGRPSPEFQRRWNTQRANNLIFVAITGTPSNGELVKFSSDKTITNGDLSGDITTAGSLVTTLATVNANVGTFSGPTINVDAKGRILSVTRAFWGITFSCQDISTKPLSTVIARAPIPFAWTLPATSSSPAGYVEGKVDTGPSAQTDFDILKDGSSIGTLRFAASATTPTFIKASDTAFVAGDYVDLKTPSNLNGIAGAFGVAIIGVR